MFSCNEQCGRIELPESFNRNTLASITAGVLFAVGWWVIIDSTCQYPSQADFNKVFYVVGAVGTLALILVNSVSNAQVRGDSYAEGCLGQVGARVVLFIAFLMAFGALIGGAWIFFAEYIPHHSDKLYPGVAIFVQNLAIFLSTLILKFGRKEDLGY